MMSEYNSNKGFTTIELVLVLSVSLIFVFSIFAIIPDLMKADMRYEMVLSEAREVDLLKRAIVQDLKQDKVYDDNKVLTIGKATYEFADEVKRNGKVVVNGKYSYELIDNTLRVYSDTVDLSFPVKSSIKEGE